MKKCSILLISALIPLSSILPVGAHGFITTSQQVTFSSGSSSFYWAFIWNYTTGTKSDDTGGYINVTDILEYACTYGSVHVAYLYNVPTGRYEEALALRNINL